MPRIRTIKPEFWADEKLAPMNAIERLTFLGLISMADDAGRLLDNVKIIDAFVFPETDETCRDALATLSRAGRIIRGKTSSGQAVIQIANWDKHQKVDKPNLKACFPKIADVVAETLTNNSESSNSRDSRECAASDSRQPRSPTYDLRPTIDDQLPTTDCDEVAPQPSTPPSRNSEEDIDPSKLRYPRFPCVKSKSSDAVVWEPSQDLILRFSETFQAVDFETEARKAHAWIMANFANRKTYGGMEDFLRRWLAKENDRRPARAGPAFVTNGKPSGADKYRELFGDD